MQQYFKHCQSLAALAETFRHLYAMHKQDAETMKVINRQFNLQKACITNPPPPPKTPKQKPINSSESFIKQHIDLRIYKMLQQLAKQKNSRVYYFIDAKNMLTFYAYDKNGVHFGTYKLPAKVTSNHQQNQQYIQIITQNMQPLTVAAKKAA